MATFSGDVQYTQVMWHLTTPVFYGKSSPETNSIFPGRSWGFPVKVFPNKPIHWDWDLIDLIDLVDLIELWTISGWWFGTNLMTFHGNVVTPSDFHSIIFQRGRYTTNQDLIETWNIYWVKPYGDWFQRFSPWLVSNVATGWLRDHWSRSDLWFACELAWGSAPAVSVVCQFFFV